MTLIRSLRTDRRSFVGSAMGICRTFPIVVFRWNESIAPTVVARKVRIFSISSVFRQRPANDRWDAVAIPERKRPIRYLTSASTQQRRCEGPVFARRPRAALLPADGRRRERGASYGLLARSGGRPMPGKSRTPALSAASSASTALA